MKQQIEIDNPTKKTKRQWLWIILIALAVSIASHAFFISESYKGNLMTGMNDGLSQMIPFKQFIYNEYTSGNFFYSDSFGFGGGFFSQLGYYFTTNIFYLIVVVIVFSMEWIGLIQHPDIQFWTDVLLPISIFRLTLIIVLTTASFRQLTFSMKASVIAAIMYGTSIIYFRHVMYWDFFSDGMLWLILLLMGVEKIIRRESPVLFIVAVSLNLITNFYFSYINFLLAFLYIVTRLFISFSTNEEKWWKQGVQFSLYGLLGFLVSTFAFIPSVVGFLNNSRPAFEDSIPLFAFTENIILNARIIYLPALVFIALFFFTLYKYPRFRFFALLIMIGLPMHFSPMIGSVFNGFSAPQYRWEHFLCLCFAGLIACVFDYLKETQLRHVVYGSTAFIGVVLFVVIYDPGSFPDRWIELTIPLLSLLTILLYVMLTRLNTQQARIIFISATVFIVLTTTNYYQATKLTSATKVTSEKYMNSELYNSPEQQQLIDKLTAQLTSDNSRIDWLASTRNNTPIVQEFDGMSVYSSILNKHLLHFYYDDLQIDMPFESVSRYASLGVRTNLYSLLNGQFYMRDKDQKAVPYGFREVEKSESYRAYENDYLLPSFRKISTFYNSVLMKEDPILAREHAMLEGAIVEGDFEFVEPPQVVELIDYKLTPFDAKYDGKLLEVTESGGLTFQFNEDVGDGDIYVSLYIEGINQPKRFLFEVNEYNTLRKASHSIYRTGINQLTIRIRADDQITLSLPNGNYHLRDIRFFKEDYETLKKVKTFYDNEEPLPIQWENGHVTGSVASEQPGEIIVTPIPYELGWSLRINGETVPLEKVNFAFLGIPLTEGMNDIEMKYRPPYFSLTWKMTAFGLLLLGIVTVYQYRKKKSIHS